MSCHSEHVARRCLKLDYLGIACNITSTCVSAAYFGLYDQQPRLARLYITIILACGLAVFWTLLDPSADGPRAAKFRYVVTSNVITLDLILWEQKNEKKGCCC